jgi:hypothetical protein
MAQKSPYEVVLSDEQRPAVAYCGPRTLSQNGLSALRWPLDLDWSLRRVVPVGEAAGASNSPSNLPECSLGRVFPVRASNSPSNLPDCSPGPVCARPGRVIALNLPDAVRARAHQPDASRSRDAGRLRTPDALVRTRPSWPSGGAARPGHVAKSPNPATRSTLGIFALCSTPVDPKPPDCSELWDADHV